MHDRDDVAEALLKAMHDLRRKSDLRDEDEHRTTPLERVARGTEVHLGLARPVTPWSSNAPPPASGPP